MVLNKKHLTLEGLNKMKSMQDQLNKWESFIFFY